MRGPVKVGDLTPETVPALVIERDGEEATLRGYVSGRRCPGRVTSAAAAAARAYREAAPDGFVLEPFVAQIRELLLAVVIGLEDDEADVLANPPDEGESDGIAVLRLLGWWNDGTSDDEDDDDDPEAPALSSTSASFSQSSAPSTALTTG